MKLLLDPRIEDLFTLFEQHQHQLYLVGGFVRDALCGVLSKDFDLCTDATPQQMQSFLQHDPLATHAAHLGNVTLRWPDVKVEITTFRIESSSLNHRHPADITFVNDIHQDVLRRDFTINALYYRHEVIDLVNGVSDLKHGLIRTVVDPNESFQQDALRMLRALRFAAQFDFTIEPTTYAALRAHLPLLNQLSSAQIRKEFDKIVVSGRYEGLVDCGLMDLWFPNFHDQNAPASPSSLEEGLATFLTCFALPIEALHSLGYGKKTLNKVNRILQNKKGC